MDQSPKGDMTTPIFYLPSELNILNEEASTDLDFTMTEPNTPIVCSQSQPKPLPDFSRAIEIVAPDIIIIHQPHILDRQYTPIHETLLYACRKAFHRDGSNFHLAEIYLTIWANTGFQAIRQDIAPQWLNHLRQQWSMRDFRSKEEQEMTLLAFSLNRLIQVNRDGERIIPGGYGGVKAQVESIVPDPQYSTLWKLRLSYPDTGYCFKEYTERLDMVLQIISDYH